jgi:chromosome segregation ATPase
VRAHDLDIAAQNLEQHLAKLAQDQRAWQAQRQALELELDGVNTRILNQRQILDQQEAQMSALAAQLERQPATEKPPSAAPPQEAAAPQRVVDLDRQVQELADQRCELVEAWERAARVHDAWHADRTQAVADLESMATRLLERDLIVQEREQTCAHADEGIRRRHQELLRLQEQMIAWRARLHTDEDAWDSDKARMLAELRSKDAAAEQHLAMLAELRQRWATRRRQEMDKLDGERAALETARKEFARLRAELLKRVAALEDEQRVIAEKSQALELYLEQTLSRAAGDPQAEHRLERLRREWVSQNAEVIRNLGRERATLHAELKAVEHRHEELHHRAVEIAAAETELMEKQTAWEEQQLLLEAQRVRLECDLHNAQEQRLFAEQQLSAAREEVERMARALLDEPSPPFLSLDQAA